MEANTSVGRNLPYKYCCVPCCCSSTVKTPNKLFLSVPQDAKRRKLWLKAARRDDVSDKTRCVYFCEDHFQMEDCVDNLMYVRMTKGRMIIKKTAMPTKFECQGKKICSTEPTRSLAKKRLRVEKQQTVSAMLACDTRSTTVEPPLAAEDPPEMEDCPQDKGTQTVKTLTKDCGIQAEPKMKWAMCSPVKAATTSRGTVKTPEMPSVSYDSSHFVGFTSDSDYAPSESDSEFSSFDHETEELKIISARRMDILVKKKPKKYLGLSENCLFILDFWGSDIKRRDIYIVLQRIKLCRTFEEIGDDFGLSQQQASAIFKSCLPKVHCKLRQLIYWPPPVKIYDNLPIGFRANYSDVVCIIDAFEIEIQKPTNPTLQAGTWSDYKKGNTIKYVVAVSPDGLIVWVSKGFGGRTSDTEIVTSSNFRDNLPPNSSVMADRGFKTLEPYLREKNCRVVRPPSVKLSGDSVMSKEEVLETKQIASLRIHVERVIERIREEKLLAAHSCVNLKFLPMLDMAVECALGFVNLQDKLIK